MICQRTHNARAPPPCFIETHLSVGALLAASLDSEKTSRHEAGVISHLS